MFFNQVIPSDQLSDQPCVFLCSNPLTPLQDRQYFLHKILKAALWTIDQIQINFITLSTIKRRQCRHQLSNLCQSFKPWLMTMKMTMTISTTTVIIINRHSWPLQSVDHPLVSSISVHKRRHSFNPKASLLSSSSSSQTWYLSKHLLEHGFGRQAAKKYPLVVGH